MSDTSPRIGGVYDHALYITSVTVLAGPNMAIGNTCILGWPIASVKFVLVSIIMVCLLENRFSRAEYRFMKSGQNIWCHIPPKMIWWRRTSLCLDGIWFVTKKQLVSSIQGADLQHQSTVAGQAMERLSVPLVGNQYQTPGRWFCGPLQRFKKKHLFF